MLRVVSSHTVTPLHSQPKRTEGSPNMEEYCLHCKETSPCHGHQGTHIAYWKGYEP